jgi:hypothetical protein
MRIIEGELLALGLQRETYIKLQLDQPETEMSKGSRIAVITIKV